jgi:hypothetical protein
MKHVYSPADIAEAHMIAHMLEQAGIWSSIQGESLLGALGELPVNNLMKIAVMDEDYDRARELILEWEKKTPPKTALEPERKISAGALVLAAFIGIAMGWLANDYKTTMSQLDELDYNKDGKRDAIFSYSFGGLFADSGKFDNDFNGTFENFVTYNPSNGAIIKSETDTDGDGKFDVADLFEYGILAQSNIMDPKTGKVVRMNYYKNSLLRSADFDSDRDGVMETHYMYDRYGEILYSSDSK